MDIELPEFMKADLWKKHLIGLYQKYWAELQQILGFEYYSSMFLRNKMDDARIANIFDEEYKEIEKRIYEAGKEIDTQERSGKSDYPKFQRTLGEIQKLQEMLQELNIKIIHHPNNQLEFLDMENKIILRTKKEINE